MAKKKLKMVKDFSDKSATDKVGEDTKYNVKNNRWALVDSYSATSKSLNYSRFSPKLKLFFEHGCDLLQYSIVIKPYIYKRYNMKHSIELDILLYLYPIQYFTQAEFKALPVEMYNYTFKLMLEMAYIEKCVDGFKTKRNVIYTLTSHARSIVKDYYMHLSGEKVLNPDSYTNPFKGKDAAKADKIRQKLMLKLRAQSEKNPSKFRKALFKKDSV